MFDPDQDDTQASEEDEVQSRETEDEYTEESFHTDRGNLAFSHFLDTNNVHRNPYY